MKSDNKPVTKIQNRKILIFLCLTFLLILTVTGVHLLNSQKSQIGPGPKRDMTVVLAWSKEKDEIPAPVQFPEWGKNTWEYRSWKWKKNIKDFTTSDTDGYKYVANGLGFTRNPNGNSIPDIKGVTRYKPEGSKDSSTSYNLKGPIQWFLFDKNGIKKIEVTKTGIGLTVSFRDAEDNKFKEWYVNKQGQVYWESLKSDNKWEVIHNLQDLKTDYNTPWSDELVEIMEYYPGRYNKSLED